MMHTLVINIAQSPITYLLGRRSSDSDFKLESSKVLPDTSTTLIPTVKSWFPDEQNCIQAVLAKCCSLRRSCMRAQRNVANTGSWTAHATSQMTISNVTSPSPGSTVTHPVWRWKRSSFNRQRPESWWWSWWSLQARSLPSLATIKGCPCRSDISLRLRYRLRMSWDICRVNTRGPLPWEGVCWRAVFPRTNLSSIMAWDWKLTCRCVGVCHGIEHEINEQLAEHRCVLLDSHVRNVCECVVRHRAKQKNSTKKMMRDSQCVCMHACVRELQNRAK